MKLSSSLSSQSVKENRPRFHWHNLHELFEHGYEDDNKEEQHEKVKKKTVTSFATTIDAFSTTTVLKSFTLASSSVSGAGPGLLCLPAGFSVC